MNRSIIIYMLGWIMNIEAVLLSAYYYGSRLPGIRNYLLSGCFLHLRSFGLFVYQEKAQSKNVFCKRRLCTGVLRLDCTQLFWLYALLAQRRNSSFY